MILYPKDHSDKGGRPNDPLMFLMSFKPSMYDFNCLSGIVETQRVEGWLSNSSLFERVSSVIYNYKQSRGIAYDFIYTIITLFPPLHTSYNFLH